MQVKLKYKIIENTLISGAFIKGEKAQDWLEEINFWNENDLDLSQISFYLIPKPNNSSEPLGLFAIFKSLNNLLIENIKEPYNILFDKLYIPFNSIIYPLVSEDEINRNLIWDIQVFNTVFGLVGFKISEKISLTSLINLEYPKLDNWNLANHNTIKKVKLTKISVKDPTPEEVFQLMKNKIENKNIKDILKDEKDSSSNQSLNNLKQGFLKNTLSLTQKFRDFLNNSSTNQSVSYQSTASILNKFENWLENKIDNIESQRDKEIKHLMDLFEKDPNEALKYAISLNNPYLGRGEAKPIYKLFKGLTNFNLSSLGGGDAQDYWNVDKYYYQLREKYLKMAEKEILDKNYTKAAYIHANLLGDFYSAANFLEQGKFYKEAAVLYKDHLKNISLASECLEKGNLTLDAIDLFKTLEKYEKVGDLYKQINLLEQSRIYYQKETDILVEEKHYLSASLILSNKLNEIEKAKNLLLKGWKSLEPSRSELCLQKYFDLILKNEPKDINNQIKNLYSQITDNNQINSFLNSILIIKNEIENQSTIIDLTYEIISKQAEKKNYSNIYNLIKLFPNDSMIKSDIGRFIKENKIKMQKDKVITLDKSVNWFQTINLFGEFIVLGVKENKLRLIRSDWKSFEQYGLFDEIYIEHKLTVINNPMYSENTFLIDFDIKIGSKKLLKDRSFNDELLLVFPNYLPDKVLAMAINDRVESVILKCSEKSIVIQKFTLDGKLKETHDCNIDEQYLYYLTSIADIFISEMIYLDGYYYTYKNALIIAILEDDYSINIIHSEDTINENDYIFETMTYFYDLNESKIVFKFKNNFVLLNTQNFETENFFRKSIDFRDMMFVSSSQLLIAEKYNVYIYDFNKSRYHEIFYSKFEIIGLLQSNKRNKGAVLQDGGLITIFEL